MAITVFCQTQIPKLSAMLSRQRPFLSLSLGCQPSEKSKESADAKLSSVMNYTGVNIPANYGIYGHANLEIYEFRDTQLII
jgi:hypothetical protein